MSSLPSPDLCNFLALRQATRHVSQLYDQHLAASGVRATQFSVLARLAARGPLSIGALAQELVMDRTTLGRNLRPLERDGLVSLRADHADARRRRLGLTAKGSALVQRSLPAWESAQAQFERAFGAERSRLLRGLAQAVSRLDLGTAATA